MVLPAPRGGQQYQKPEKFSESGRLAEVIPFPTPILEHDDLVLEMIQDARRRTESIHSDESIRGRFHIFADNLGVVAEALSGENLPCLETVEQLQSYLYDEQGRLWLASTLLVANPRFELINFGRTHLISDFDHSEFTFSLCASHANNAHYVQDWLSLPIQKRQPLKMRADRLLIDLEPHASLDFGIGVRTYAETLSEILSAMRESFLSSQDPYRD